MCIIRVKRQSFRFFSGFWILFHQFLLWIWVLVRQLKEKILWKRTIKEDSNHYEIQSKCNFSNCCTSNERTLHDPGRLLTNMQSGAFVAQSIITILSSWVDTLVLFLSWSEMFLLILSCILHIYIVLLCSNYFKYKLYES